MKAYYLDKAKSLHLIAHTSGLEPKLCYRNTFEAICSRLSWNELGEDSLEVCYGYLKFPDTELVIRHCFLKQGTDILDPTFDFLAKGIESEPYYLFKSYSIEDYLAHLNEAQGDASLATFLRKEEFEFQKQLMAAGLYPVG